MLRSKGVLDGDSFASLLGMQMHIMHLWLKSETFESQMPNHQCRVSCAAAQASIVCHAISVSWKTS